jgi:glycosyltransferase involved in cell wall biosynthesis
MKKVIFLVSSLNSGGIENYLLRFLNYFDGQIEPIVICKGDVFGELEEDYKKITHIQLIKIKLGFFDFKAYCNIYAILKKSNAQSVCDFTGNFAGLLLLVANIADIKKRVVFYRGSSNHFKETNFKLFYNKMMRYLVKKNATKVLSNSKASLDYFYCDRDINDKQFEVVYNGIDAKKFVSTSNKFNREDFEIPADAFVIGHTGRYNLAKNHETIIKVAEILCAKHKSIYFMLCGKDTDVFLLDRVSNNSILKNKVKILGYRNDINNILPVFDVYFFPSTTEGQPNSLIEAMISGLPIVASNIGPIIETTPEILHNDLLNPMDVDGFCNRLEEYYFSKKKREVGNFSIWAVERFAPETLFNQFHKEL